MIDQTTQTNSHNFKEFFKRSKKEDGLALDLQEIKENKVQLSKLFYKNHTLKSSKSSIYERSTEKERELLKLEKRTMNPVKLNKDYLNKLNYLLQSKNDPEYSKKRKNMNQIIYKFNSNNNLCLTLPKCVKNSNDEINEKDLNTNNNNNNISFIEFNNKCDDLNEETNDYSPNKPLKFNKEAFELMPSLNINQDEKEQSNGVKAKSLKNLNDTGSSMIIAGRKKGKNKLSINTNYPSKLFKSYSSSFVRSLTKSHNKLQLLTKPDKIEFTTIFKIFNKFKTNSDKYNKIKDNPSLINLNRNYLFDFDYQLWKGKQTSSKKAKRENISKTTKPTLWVENNTAINKFCQQTTKLKNNDTSGISPDKSNSNNMNMKKNSLITPPFAIPKDKTKW